MIRKIVAFSLAAVLGTSGLLLTNSQFAMAETLHEKKKQIEQQQSEVSSNLDEKQTEIDRLKKEEEQLNEEIKELDFKVSDTNSKIREKNASIEETRKEIDALNVKIAEVKERIEKRTKLLEERARSLQESGGMISYLDVLLGAQSFGDFVGRVSAVSAIVEADRDIIRAHEEDKNLLVQAEADLKNQLAKLEQSLRELESLKAELDSQVKQKQELMKKVQEKHEEAVHEMHELEDEAQLLAEQKRAIEAEEKRQREAAERAARERKSSGSSSSSQTPAVTSGSFMWPASGTFTSGYGPRWGKLHAGIDIANRADVPIVASAGGTIIRSHYSSSYGNVVYISHRIDGQVFTTVYAHMETRFVSAGQAVSKGQQIGIMGNTGRSTGQHLHFEIHKGPWNGQQNAVNPLDYLP